MAPSMPCPDETTISQLVDGHLAIADRETVERHVDACAGCRELVAVLVRAAEPVPTIAVTLERGESIDRYLVLERIGAGGMGVVYSAYDSDLDRKVALKLLRPEVISVHDEDEARTRLLREAKALARLDHPNVLTVYGAGTWCGQVYLALELVDGEDLRSWRVPAKSVAEIIEVYRQAGEGLAAAHASGLVHRDFKPANVFVGQDGRARVGDFGLARAVEDDGGPHLAGAGTGGLQTHASRVMGTPAYMAPEQVGTAQVDARADQFAFCVALYEALAGRRPWASSSDEPRDLLARDGPARAPGREIPPPVWRVLQRGLQLEPERRFPSMQALLEAMAPRRRRWPTVVVTLGLVAAVGVGWWLRRPPAPTEAQLGAVAAWVDQARAAASEERYLYPPPDDPTATTAYRAVLHLEQIDDPSHELARERAQSLRSEFATTLSKQAEDLWDRAGGRAYAIDLYAIALVFDPDDPDARRRAALTPGELAVLRAKGAALEFTTAELERAEPLAALAEPEPEARIERLRVATERGKGRQRATKPDQLHALLADIEGHSKPTEAPPPAESPASEVGVPATPDDESSDEASTGSDDATSTPAADTSERDPARAASLASAGAAALKGGELDRAARLFARAVSLDPTHHKALIGLGDVAFERGDYGQAIKYTRRAVRQAPRRARYRIRLGDALFAELRYAEARKEYARAHELGHKLAPARLERVDDKLGQ